MRFSPSAVRELARVALSFIYPESCQICRTERATIESGLVCASCWRQVRFIRPPFCERCGLPFSGEITTVFECANCQEMELHFGSARSAVAAGGMVRDVIHRYKYQRALWFEPFLADLLIREAAPMLRGGCWNGIVPVPLHPAKEREREFNQAERLAQRLSAATGIPVDSQFLKRIEPTRTQTRLSRTERAANVRRAFALCDPQRRVAGGRFILLDDVFTTGATTSACARVLHEAGAEEVCVWTVARGL